MILSGQIKTDAVKPPSSSLLFCLETKLETLSPWSSSMEAGACAASLLLFTLFRTYPAAAVSPPWPPSPRLLAGSCQSFWISPRQPCPRRSPCSPWLRTHDPACTDEQRKWGELRCRCRADVSATVVVVPVCTEAQTQPWAEFWPTWLKSHRRSSLRLHKFPRIIWILIEGDYVHVDTPGDVCSSMRAQTRLFARCRPGDERAATAAVVAVAPRNFLTVLPRQLEDAPTSLGWPHSTVQLRAD